MDWHIFFNSKCKGVLLGLSPKHLRSQSSFWPESAARDGWLLRSGPCAPPPWTPTWWTRPVDSLHHTNKGNNRKGTSTLSSISIYAYFHPPSSLLCNWGKYAGSFHCWRPHTNHEDYGPRRNTPSTTQQKINANKDPVNGCQAQASVICLHHQPAARAERQVQHRRKDSAPHLWDEKKYGHSCHVCVCVWDQDQ